MLDQDPIRRLPPTPARPPRVAVLTCPRRGGSYVVPTLRQIEREGGRELSRRLHVDGTERETEALCGRLASEGLGGWEVERLGGDLGSTEAMRRVLLRAARDEQDLLFFEDDLLLSRNAVSRMVGQAVPEDCALVTFFDMKEVPVGSARGLYRTRADGRDGSGFWGAQCLRIPSGIVDWLAERDWNSVAVGDTRMASDILVGRLLAGHPSRSKLAIHIPCLVEHVGSSSACFPGQSLSPRWRRASNFAGAKFDALSLPSMT